MGTFTDALMGRKSQPTPARIDPATIAQPVPVAMMTEPPSELSSGSSLNRASSAWPDLVDSGAKFWNGGWRKSFLKEVSTERVPGNYGLEGGQVHYGFRYRAFFGVANYPIEGSKSPFIKTYNDLVPIQWGLRIANPNIIPMSTAQTGPITIQSTPSTWLGSNTASLVRNGVTLL